MTASNKLTEKRGLGACRASDLAIPLDRSRKMGKRPPRLLMWRPWRLIWPLSPASKSSTHYVYLLDMVRLEAETAAGGSEGG